MATRTAMSLCWIAMLGLTATTSARATAADAEGDAQVVDVFAAMENGDIELKFIPQDARKANIIVANKTDKPLHVQFPDTFAAVPVLAQMGMGGMGGGMGGMGGGMGGMGGGMGGGGQAMGGGMGGGGMGGMGGGMGGMGGGGMGGGFMRVAPERTAKTQIATLCLEHGKPDPTPRMKYTIVPLEQVTGDERVAELCKAVANGQLPQNTAQAVAWHYTDGLSWQQLAMKNRVESRYRGNIKFFSPIELRNAVTIAARLEELVGGSSSDDSQLTSGSSSSDYAVR